MARRLLWASLALAPVTWLVDAFAHPGKVALFILSALSLTCGVLLSTINRRSAEIAALLPWR